jgi:hypothetical protein
MFCPAVFAREDFDGFVLGADGVVKSLGILHGNDAISDSYECSGPLDQNAGCRSSLSARWRDK